ncbi:MAG TPA: helix-turn-helix domain-containing protein [Jiangellaceae bacterium]|nr:helix-turn-helix domain-containing protein [Jiangellaceae bacterium]
MDVAVQHVVDRLASRLRRPAVLEDRFFRLVTYSAHDEPVDEVREASILRRHASADVSRWLSAVGIRLARGPVRVPGNAELNMLPRICFPVRYREMLLGYLWFVDADESVGPADLEWCVQEITDLGTLLHRESVASVPSSERVAETLRALLSDSPTAAVAARDLTDDGLISADDGVVVAVLQAVRGPATAGTAVRDALTEALIGSPHLYRRGSALHLARKDHSVLLLAAPGTDDVRLRSQLESLHSIATSELATTEPHVELVIGVGSHQPELAGAYESYREGRMAAMAGGALSTVGPVVQWTELGVYQVAANLVARGEVAPVLHEGLRSLLDSPEALPLLETLETYLDAAGNAQVTAETLHLHRTSLYYRLQRVEQLARTDLKDGMERLALHLTLKVARLTGQYVPRHCERAAATEPEPALRRIGRVAERAAQVRVAIPAQATR